MLVVLAKIYVISVALNLIMLPRLYQKTGHLEDIFDHITALLVCFTGCIPLVLTLFFIYGSIFLFVVVLREYPNEDAFWEDIKSNLEE